MLFPGGSSVDGSSPTCKSNEGPASGGLEDVAELLNTEGLKPAGPKTVVSIEGVGGSLEALCVAYLPPHGLELAIDTGTLDAPEYQPTPVPTVTVTVRELLPSASSATWPSTSTSNVTV